MRAEKIIAQLQTGVLEYCVLQIIRRGEIYASDIIDELLEEGLIKVEGIIYPLLIRLKHENMLEYEWTDAQNGLPKKHYALTDDGQRTIIELDQTWMDIHQSARKIKRKTEDHLKSTDSESKNTH